jgi:hypothetical protein
MILKVNKECIRSEAHQKKTLCVTHLRNSINIELRSYACIIADQLVKNNESIILWSYSITQIFTGVAVILFTELLVCYTLLRFTTTMSPGMFANLLMSLADALNQGS